MEQAIREQYSECVLQELMGKYGIDPGRIKALNGFESFIYQFEKDGGEYILRVSHTGLRRTKAQIAAEVDFINYLADHGVPAARAIPSAAGNLLEVAEKENPDFVAIAFEKAKGGPPQKHHWQPLFFQHYGETMGRMHRLAKSYVPSHPDHQRPDGMVDLIGFAERFLPTSESAIVEKWNELLEQLQTLPRGTDDYGLIHQDLHGGNFFIDGDNRMTIFDFDDCQYFWFAHDVAMALFYVVPHNCVGKENNDRAQAFLKHFMLGYRRENTLAPEWLKMIPVFLRLREMDLYIAIHRSMDIDNLTPWCASFMDGRREKILKEQPYVDIDFCC